jgi:serine/threonine-protein kinase
MPGQLVAGRYRIEAELGRGGHGVVYRATQQPLGHEVALKMLLPEAVFAQGSVERFMREAALAQRLEHPNTIRLFDFGQTEQGLPFIVWELLRGRTLDQEIARQPLSVMRTARITTQILKSLMEAHAHGIVHRDIKPSNVFVGDHAGESDFVKVLDFGVATTLPGAAHGPNVTRDGQIIGTPMYMAPEQVSGGVLSPRTDLYALGLVMAEALTGVCIMNDTSAIKVWMAQASAAPVPLPQDVLHSTLGPVIARATQKSAEARYASAAEMLADIERVISSSTAATDALHKPLHRTMPISMQPPVMVSPPPGPPTPLWSGPPQGIAPSTTPLGQAMSYAPHASQPAQVLAAPQATTNGLLVATLVAAIVAIVGLVGVVAFLALRRPAAPGGPESPPPPVNVTAGKLDKVTRKRTEERLTNAGWTIRSVQEDHISAGYMTTTFSISRPPRGGVVTIYDYESESQAKALVAVLNNSPGSASTRDGGRVLFVAMLDQTASRQLVEELAR